jgi:hypothetical protein
MNCTAHPQEPISGTCDRCGNFVCRLDSERDPSGRTICADCRTVHGTADWLEKFRLELWGKRDAYAWLFGALGLIYTAVAIGISLSALSSGASGAFVVVGMFFVLGAVQAAYFFRQRWARIAIIVIPVLVCFANIGIMAAVPGARPNGMPLFGVILPLAAYFDTRNKLFFKIEVPETKLLKLWDTLRNNQLARTGFACGLLGLLIPGLGVIGLICSIVGLRRVNPDAVPPIGKKGYAIAGIILSGMGILLWAALFVFGASA